MRHKLEITNKRSELALQIKSAKEWDRLTFQHSIDKIDQEMGVAIKGCLCPECRISRGMINQILMLASALEIEGIEYENDVEGKPHE